METKFYNYSHVRLAIEPHSERAARWPLEGRHILAQYDDERVGVYQAFRPEVGHLRGLRVRGGAPARTHPGARAECEDSSRRGLRHRQTPRAPAGVVRRAGPGS